MTSLYKRVRERVPGTTACPLQQSSELDEIAVVHQETQWARHETAIHRACMEQAHREKRQQRFGHRRLLVKPQLSFSTPQSRQSTLTQHDFFSTPRGSDNVNQTDDDIDETYAEERPRKRMKRTSTSEAARQKKNTLTQIGFVHPSGEVSEEWQNAYVKDSYSDEEELTNSVSIEEQAVIQVHGTPRGRQSEIHDEEIVPASQPSNTESDKSWKTALQYSTPRASRRLEAPSSQTPSSIALSTRHRSRQSPAVQRSPLHNRSINIGESPRNAKHIQNIVLLSSPVVARDFAVTQPADYDAPEALQRRNYSSVAFIDDLGGQEEDDQQSALQSNMLRYSTIDDNNEQFTYDPALSALDRDAARFAMTQLHQPLTAKVRETQLSIPSSSAGDYELPGETNDEEEVVANRPDDAERVIQFDPPVMSIPDSQPVTPLKHNSALPPSQVSTVSPTQNTNRGQAREQLRSSGITAINTISSDQSSLPRPPWTESERLEWLGNDKALLNRIDTLSSDYSLPAPPPFDDET